MGKVLGGHGGGTTLSSAARSFCAYSALRNSSFILSNSSFLLYDAAKSACILSCSTLDAATLSCNVRIISKTCAIVTAPSSADGAGEACLVFLIFSTKNLKNKRNLTAKCGWDHKFTRAPWWAPNDLAGASNVEGFATSNSIFDLLNRDKCKNAPSTPQELQANLRNTPNGASSGRLQNNQRTKNLCETRVHFVCV